MSSRERTRHGCAVALPLAFLLWIGLAGLVLLAIYVATRVF
jgi:hypothetical protein